MSILIIQDNKKARFDYEILEVFEAGIVLTGSEVKSLRDKNIQLKDSYVSFVNGEAFLQNAHISPYKASSYNNHTPERLRKLLLNRRELNQIMGKVQERGLSCIPLKIFFKKGLVKLDLGLVRGKKLHDKRESIKERESNKSLKQTLRHSR
ncbi:MAG: SsrA-binding protein SmpB [Bdellovibrionaceae bacterium]|nr:SsrA-binding protein SmpB [Pseudobdellovibrionaceae bacterium]